MLFQEFPCMQTGQGQARLSLAFRVRGSVGQKRSATSMLALSPLGPHEWLGPPFLRT